MLLHHLSALFRDEPRSRGTRSGTCALSCLDQAVLVLHPFRESAGAEALARDNAISIPTVYRYIDEGADVLAHQAPTSTTPCAAREHDGLAVLDGKLFASDRCRTKNAAGTSDLWFSGHKHRHGGNVQFLADAHGESLRVSPVEPGSVPDIVAARIHVLPRLRSAARAGLTGTGYDGAGAGLLTPLKRPAGVSPDRLHYDNQARDLLLRSTRCTGERAMAVLTGRWNLLRHTTRSPSKIGDIVNAALTLTILEKRTR